MGSGSMVARSRASRSPANAPLVAAQPSALALPATHLELHVQRGQAPDLWHQHQEVAPGIADQALHPALVVAFARAAEAIRKQVVRLQLGKSPGALSRAIAQDIARATGTDGTNSICDSPARYRRLHQISKEQHQAQLI
jgi:hypothetical protein